MIIGIGIDLIELERIENILNSEMSQRFIQRILSPSEQEMLTSYTGKRKIEFIAGRFAAKEAVSKAFGVGIGAAMSFQEIEILPDEFGKPCCHVPVQLTEKEDEAEFHIHVSITHTKDTAAAYVVVEKRTGS